MMPRLLTCVVLLLPLFISASPSPAQQLSSTPELSCRDRPFDEGNAIELSWHLPAHLTLDSLQVQRSAAPDSGFTLIASLSPDETRFTDDTVSQDQVFYYKVIAFSGSQEVCSAVSQPIAARANWFHSGRLSSFIIVVVYTALILGFIYAAQRGTKLFIRRVAGLNAIDEAIGRATELGKKIIYIPGILSIDEIQTLASLSVLRHVARASAQYNAELEVPNKDPLTFAAARETVREAYFEQGRPELYREEMVNFVTFEQFAYTAAVSGKMAREKPATVFLIGSFFAESLLLAETGFASGAIQIAGTAEVNQLPFFVCACDYTLIGEELYAASAYLSREPVILGSIKGQDVFKLILIIFIVLGIILETVGITWLTSHMTMI